MSGTLSPNIRGFWFGSPQKKLFAIIVKDTDAPDAENLARLER
jgi:hypothetical protein